MPWEIGNSAPPIATACFGCYPFNFIGNAPKRFIVHADRFVAAPQQEPSGPPAIRRPRDDECQAADAGTGGATAASSLRRNSRRSRSEVIPS